MKTITIVSALFFFSSRVFAQDDAITNYLSKYSEDKQFENVYISSKMLRLLSGSQDNAKDKQFLEILGTLKGLRILTCECATSKQLYTETNTLLTGKGFESLMTIKERGDEQLTFLIKNSQGGVQELLLLSSNRNEFLLLSLIGNIDLKKISRLSEGLNVEGIENLKELEKKPTGKK